MELAEFLRQRLDEDEAAAQAALEQSAEEGTRWWFDDAVPETPREFHVARHDPARVLREVEAKRAILVYYEQAQAKLDHIVAHPREMTSGDEGMWLGRTATARMAVRYHAAIYRDHADYDEAWKP